MNDVSIWAAFLGGVLSFFAPCIFPLVPAYLGFVAGTSGARKIALINALLFVVGFSSVFVALGAASGFLGFYVLRHFPWIITVSGAVVVVFGLWIILMALDVPWSRVRLFTFMYRQKRWNVTGQNKPLAWSFVIGASFGFGWTPCIGPILGGILALAYSNQTALEGAALLAVYSAGLGIPFIFSALFVNRLQGLIRKMGKVYLAIEIASGLLLVALGLLIVTDKLVLLNYFFI
ncbi:MAG: cytochrome c biogenesis protein CcdA [Candidatus Spechtbacterales bacterium]